MLCTAKDYGCSLTAKTYNSGKSKIGHERKQQTMKLNSQRINYPQGSISTGTMRPEDLIPTFASELESLARRKNTGVSAKYRKAHRKLVTGVQDDIDHNPPDGYGAGGYFSSDGAVFDLESLFDALDAYAGPYFYFGAHPGDGSDYGFWLSENWDEDFEEDMAFAMQDDDDYPDSIKVNDVSEIPVKFRGEVAVVNDHGNVTLYLKTARTLREIWSVA